MQKTSQLSPRLNNMRQNYVGDKMFYKPNENMKFHFGSNYPWKVRWSSHCVWMPWCFVIRDCFSITLLLDSLTALMLVIKIVSCDISFPPSGTHRSKMAAAPGILSFHYMQPKCGLIVCVSCRDDTSNTLSSATDSLDLILWVSFA